MENSCKEKYRMSSKKWIPASRCTGFRRNSALVPANAGLYAYVANNPVRYIDPDGRFLIGAIIGFISSTVTEVGGRIIQGQSFRDAISNTFSDSTSRKIIISSTIIGGVTSGASGLAVKATAKTATTASSLAVRTVMINTVSGAIDAGAKDIATRAIKNEPQSIKGTAYEIAKGGASAFIASGATQTIIASGAKSSSQIVNVMTHTVKDYKFYSPSWAGAVGNIGENVIPTTIDLIQQVKNIKKEKEKQEYIKKMSDYYYNLYANNSN